MISTQIEVTAKWINQRPEFEAELKKLLGHQLSLKEHFIVFWLRNDVFVFELKIGMPGRRKPSLARTEKVSGTQKSGNFFSVSDETSRDEVVRD